MMLVVSWLCILLTAVEFVIKRVSHRVAIGGYEDSQYVVYNDEKTRMGME